MLFSVNDKHLIKVLRKEKQYNVREFLKECPNKKWFHSCINYFLEKSTNLAVLNALPVVVDHGQRIMLKTSSQSVHSQEDRPHSHCSVKKIARKAHILARLYMTLSRNTCRLD